MKRLLLLICGLLVFSPVVGFAEEYPTKPQNHVVDIDGELSESTIKELSLLAQEMSEESEKGYDYYFVFKNSDSHDEQKKYAIELQKKWGRENKFLLVSLDNLYLTFNDNYSYRTAVTQLELSSNDYYVIRDYTKEEVSIYLGNIFKDIVAQYEKEDNALVNMTKTAGKTVMIVIGCCVIMGIFAEVKAKSRKKKGITE